MILHLDMDAFYAAIEQRDQPELQGRCVIVGGQARRGVVATASYEARRHGVRSAMPIYQARQLCPQAVVMPVRMAHYAAVSRAIMRILDVFSPLVEPVSIDEAYLDISGSERLFGTPLEMAQQIKARIRQELSLTASIGLAPVKFLAKIASEMQKPDGLTLITAADVPALIERLPIENVPGVGPVTRKALTLLGIHTLCQVRDLPAALLERKLGQYGPRLLALAQGIDPRPVQPPALMKSISAEETLSSDTLAPAILNRCLLAQSETIGRRLRRRGLKARTLTLKIKFTDFTTLSRAAPLKPPAASAERFYRAAQALLAQLSLKQAVRLIGLGAGNFAPRQSFYQAALFEPAPQDALEDAWEKVEPALDTIVARYGAGSITRAGLKEEP